MPIFEPMLRKGKNEVRYSGPQLQSFSQCALKYMLSTVAMWMLFSSCRKEPESLPFRKIEMPVSTTYRDLWIFNENEMVVCGGDEQHRVLLITVNGGENWQKGIFLDQPDDFINTIFFINRDTGFCGDGEVIIRRTIDGGLHWHSFYDQTWPIPQNRILRKIWFTDTTNGFICGGKGLGHGMIYKTENTGASWNWTAYDHEYRAVCFANQSNGLVGGYGSLLITDDGGHSFHNSSFTGYYITGIDVGDDGCYWICDLNGVIFKSCDGGNTLHQSRKGTGWSINSRQLNDIAVSSDGKIAAAGPSGFVTVSSDGGQNWNDYMSFSGTDIYRIKWLSESIIMAVGSNGGVYQLEIE